MQTQDSTANREECPTLNRPDTGYRGIWYMNQPEDTVYRYKYSGGLGTYCAKHKPFAFYSDAAAKTFFCYGGAATDDDRRLHHMVSYYDHRTNSVPQPVCLLDKQTDDAHDNPVISIDGDGHIWIFSTSHGVERPSYIHRSRQPYDISEFEIVNATYEADGRQVPLDNFSYMQVRYLPDAGFVCFFTKYGWGTRRPACFMTSADGCKWSARQQLATMGQGHYQVSAVSEQCAGSAFNYHPQDGGLNYRTNLYYIETQDHGRSWQNAAGGQLELPLSQPDNAALVHDYAAEGLKVYMKDIRFDTDGRPVILYITSRGFEPGPQNGPRQWTVARWTGREWKTLPVTAADSNYDTGSLYVESDGAWRIIAPTEVGPQPGNPGGEMTMWLSRDRGENWELVRQLTHNSERNHNYARAPINAHPDFYALWADGHGRQPSISDLYYCNRAGDVYKLPRVMSTER